MEIIRAGCNPMKTLFYRFLVEGPTRVQFTRKAQDHQVEAISSLASVVFVLTDIDCFSLKGETGVLAGVVIDSCNGCQLAQSAGCHLAGNLINHQDYCS